MKTALTDIEQSSFPLHHRLDTRAKRIQIGISLLILFTKNTTGNLTTELIVLFNVFNTTLSVWCGYFLHCSEQFREYVLSNSLSNLYLASCVTSLLTFLVAPPLCELQLLHFNPLTDAPLRCSLPPYSLLLVPAALHALEQLWHWSPQTKAPLH